MYVATNVQGTGFSVGKSGRFFIKSGLANPLVIRFRAQNVFTDTNGFWESESPDSSVMIGIIEYHTLSKLP